MNTELKASLKRFYFELKSLLSYNKWYESNVDAIREEFNFVFEIEEISDKTKSKFRSALDFLNDYYKSVSFSKNPVFKFFDPTFITFLSNSIIPLLESIKTDLQSHNLDLLDNEEFEIVKPQDEVVIKEIENLYLK